jgi:uncharacterized protein with HEPN domain
MLSDKARLALSDILDNAKLAQQFIAGMSLESFKGDRRAFYAATGALEIISEAARRLPAELHARHPELPWRNIMDAGSIYRHGYENVAELREWRTLHDSLPALVTAVEHELDRLDGGR